MKATHGLSSRTRMRAQSPVSCLTSVAGAVLALRSRTMVCAKAGGALRTHNRPGVLLIHMLGQYHQANPQEVC